MWDGGASSKIEGLRVKSPVESPAEPPASAGVLTGEDLQRLLNMFLGSLTPKNEILVSIVRAPKGRVVV